MKSYGLKPATPEAMKLMMEGAIAFSRMEATGLRVDTAYLSNAIESVKKQIAEMEKKIKDCKEYAIWAKLYGNKMKLGSRPQLAKVLFDTIGHKRNKYLQDKDGKEPNSEAAFEHLKLPFKDMYFGIAKMKKALATYLLGLQREMVNGFIHPFFHLHTTESYRSSSSEPNFHNQPRHNKEIAKIVRTAIIPRKGRVFLEPDYSTQEVKIAYCYCKDPKLKSDILTGDMHTDRALELFLLTRKEMGPPGKQPGKDIRFVAKNDFVFAQFYGSYYGKCAPNLWDSMSLMGLKLADGTSMFEHLESKGITRLGKCDPEFEPVKGTYEYLVQQVQEKMWNESYPVYNQWRRDIWDVYQRQGGINTLTGFRMEGVFRRNQILCDQIQGSAFHCLLWSFIEIQKELLKRKMKSRLVNQIHDSMLIDAVESEIPDLVEIVREYAIKRLMQHWKWIVVPLSIDFEVCRDNWFNKTPLEEMAA